MTTIRIQPPMIDVPKGEYCDPFSGKNCVFLEAIVSCWWCRFEGRDNPVKYDRDAMAHFKRPFCLAACAEAEKKEIK